MSSSFVGPKQDVVIIKLDREIKTKAGIQPRISFFSPDVDLKVGDIVKVLSSGEERTVTEVNLIYGRGNKVHHKEVKLVNIKK